MSNPVEDFIISLGFDTSKVTKQITTLQNNLAKMAENLDKKRVANGLKAEKQITANVVKETTARNKGVLKQQDSLNKQILAKEKKLAKDRTGLYGKPSTTTPIRPSSPRSVSSSSTPLSIESARRQQAIRALVNPEANPQLKAMGSYYRKLQADQSDMGNKSERARKRAKMSLITNSAAFRSLSRSDDPEARQQAAQFLRQARGKVAAGKFTEIAGIKSDIQEYVKSLKQVNVQKAKSVEHDAHITAFQKQQAAIAKKQAKLAALKPTQTNITALMQRYRANGLMGRGGEDAIMAGAMKQSTQKQADAYIKASLRAMEYSNKGVGNKKDTMRIISEGNVQVLSKANMQLASMHAKMAAVERRSIGTAAAFGGMHDSARNMVREMASVYAIMAATGAIKEQVKAVDGAKAGLVAVTNDATEAAEAFSYLKETILQNGLSVKDASKDFVKLKAAMGKDASMQDSMDAFTSLAKTGVVFQISQEDMSGTIRALGQIKTKGLPPK